MKKLQLLVAVKETAYLDRLADYIRRSTYGEQWQLTAFTNVNSLRQYLKSGYPADLLAVHSSMASEIREAAGSAPLAILISRAGQPMSRQEVTQFQPLPSLLQALTAVYASGTEAPLPAEMRGGRRTVIAAVGSAASGIGRTTLSLRLGQQAGTRGANVFYLNLEQWNGSAAWFRGEEAGDQLSQLLYTIQAEPERAGQKLAELKRRHAGLKMDYLPPSPHAMERLSMSTELTERLIAVIAECGLYDLIVIDTDNRIDDVMAGVLHQADLMLWLAADHPAAQMKNKLALQYVKQRWSEYYDAFLAKFRVIAISRSPLTKADSESGMRLEGTLPYPEAEEAEHGGNAFYRSAVDRILDRLQVLGKGGVPAGSNHTGS
ncbi:hypothetical protein FHS18_005022 [Paenibacillus phyllosphaerae]|uniref:CobQ/CobB/MinD/ParA nucleotide binding domain-containing protein n=1 Tax=Paenibacillus phyllosphaerae TaxID=274593 RepID=A0A7W5B1X0_9BACL|nr:hypothetical protein [Paenibacillus phyllosphaerae]MBB3112920.1 hypothetical protein [Paenibacillus phyllosphaerae]